jgi:hypothetical protein
VSREKTTASVVSESSFATRRISHPTAMPTATPAPATHTNSRRTRGAENVPVNTAASAKR